MSGITTESISKPLQSLKENGILKLGRIDTQNFANRLDRVFEKAKQETYNDTIEEYLVKLNKTENPEEYITAVVRGIDDNISAAVKRRSELPTSDVEQLTEDDMITRGKINGLIAAQADVKVCVFELSSEIARNLAMQTGRYNS